MKLLIISALILLSGVLSARADDGQCVRNNCLGTCISKQEALGKMVPMICHQNYVCYQDVECMKLDSGKCGWKETAELKSCLAEKAVSK